MVPRALPVGTRQEIEWVAGDFGLLAKALEPMLVTELGMVTEVSWLYVKAWEPILVTELGMVTEVSWLY